MKEKWGYSFMRSPFEKGLLSWEEFFETQSPVTSY
jgi:hypothetical protein